jgi:preprotein translocase subunit YajC
MNAIVLQAAQGQQGGGMSIIIMMVVLFAIVYFFMIRPQNKKQKEIQKFRNALTVGQDVVTIGGIHGTVKAINEDEGTVTLEVATGVKITFAKEAINPIATNNKK